MEGREMIPIIDFQRRSLTGPVVKAQDFDLSFSFKVRELVEEYGIAYDAEQLVVDDAMADAVFEAGVELLAEIGLYQMNTQRVIQYSVEEIEEIAGESRENPAAVAFGRHPETMTLRSRRSADSWKPTCYAGAPGVAEKEWFIAYVQSFAQEECVEGIGVAPGLAVLDGIEPKAGTLSDVHVALWEQDALVEALRRAGRPGMNLGLLSTVTAASAIMTIMQPGLRDATNTQIGIHIMPEQKIDWSRLLLAQYCQQSGIEPWQSSMSCIGGFCRDAAEAAVAMVANALGQMSYANGRTMSYFPSHLDGTWATRPSHWAFSAACRASERHTGLAVGTSISGITEAWRTPLTLWQAAAVATVSVASGMSYAWIAGHTGLEARLIDEIMDATAGMPADRANELAQKIMGRVDELLPSAKEQLPFPEAYDLETVQPTPEYEASLLRVKDELAGMGMPYRYSGARRRPSDAEPSIASMNSAMSCPARSLPSAFQ
jgi:methylamine--corrinoid protein Co-methyltransferase